MRRLLAIAVLPAALMLIPAAVPAQAEPAKAAPREINIWAGQWITNASTKGGFAFRALAVKHGFEAFAELGADRCYPPTTYYRGGYYDPVSGRGGKIVGCTEGAWHLVGRYVGDPNKDPGAKGNIDIDFKLPNTFDGTYTPDGSSKSYAYHGVRGMHFEDYCCGSLVVNFNVRASGKPNLEIKSKSITPVVSGTIKTVQTSPKAPHATFTKYNAKVPDILEATETKGGVVVDLTSASGGKRHYEFGVVSRTGYSTQERRLGLLLRTKVSNDPACPAGKSGAILFALPTFQGVRDSVILVGVPFSQTIEINAFLVTLSETTDPCKGLAYGWTNGDSGVHVSARLAETVPGATS
jgi:hypothetical protein